VKALFIVIKESEFYLRNIAVCAIFSNMFRDVWDL
jgi:hypothetical protein